MSTPYWTNPGTFEGRIAPAASLAIGSLQGAYEYGGYSYTYDDPYYAYDYSGYGYDSSGKVFCLGTDEYPFPLRRLRLGDVISVRQSFDISSVQKLLRFSWHMRMPSTMPQSRDLITAGVVSLVNGSGVISRAPPHGTATTPDGCIGFVIEDTPESQLTRDDVEKYVTISGAAVASNNAQYILSGIPMNQGGLSGGDRALLRNPSVPYPYGHPSYPGYPVHPLVETLDDAAVTIRLHGLRWTVRAHTNTGAGWVERVSLREQPLHTQYRSDLALNVSKFTGTLQVKFELALELAP